MTRANLVKTLQVALLAASGLALPFVRQSHLVKDLWLCFLVAALLVSPAERALSPTANPEDRSVSRLVVFASVAAVAVRLLVT